MQHRASARDIAAGLLALLLLCVVSACAPLVRSDAVPVASEEMATAAGIPTVIASGLTAGTIAAAATGVATGTGFPAQEGRYSSFKLWLKYAKPVRGRDTIPA